MIGRLRNWLARRRAPGPGGREDWAPGELAECIHPGPWFMGGRWPRFGFGPRLGVVYRVTAVETPAIAEARQAGDVMLRFAAWPDKKWVSSAFRKVRLRPDAAEAADAAFVASLKPARAPAQTPAHQPEKEAA